MSSDTFPGSAVAMRPATWDVLLTLGFQPDPSVISEGRAGLSKDVGGWKLTAGLMSNLQLKPVVVFGGVVMTARSACRIEFEMPTTVESMEQCAAWIAWHLMEQLPKNDRVISPKKAAFVVLGLAHQSTLPWVQDLNAYKARPTCTVGRAWLRQAFRQLSVDAADAEPDSACLIAFDGNVLTFCTSVGLVPVPGRGEKWPCRYSLAIANLSRLPARLKGEHVQISVWKNRLHIGNRVYECLALADSPTNVEPTVQGQFDFERS